MAVKYNLIKKIKYNIKNNNSIFQSKILCSFVYTFRVFFICMMERIE